MSGMIGVFIIGYVAGWISVVAIIKYMEEHK